MTEMRKGPVLIELDGPAPSPGDAPPVAEALVVVPAAPVPRKGRLGALTATAVGGLLTFVLGVALWDFVAGLLARNTLLGSVALAAAGLAVVLLAVMALREALAYARLGRLEDLRAAVAVARGGTLAQARAATARIAGLYAGRAEMAWARAGWDEAQAGVMDADALVDLAERRLMAPLDAAARREIEAAARQVAAVTALVPLALADVAVALWANLRMIRRIAQLYGGRSGALGSARLLRRVVGHLVATGALALTDDMIGSVAGGGVISKLSRRFGEGVVNGALTARVGIAAMELCRPMPFVAQDRPGVAAVLGRAVAGLFDRSGAAG